MKREAGFTIVSVLVAIILLSMGAMSLSHVATGAMVVQTQASNRSIAAGIGRAHLEKLHRIQPEDVAAESPVRVNAEGVVDAGGDYVRTVYVDLVRRNVKEVKITIEYPRSTRPVEFVTQIFVSSF